MNSPTSSKQQQSPSNSPISHFHQALTTTCSSILNSFTTHFNTHLSNFASTSSSSSFNSPAFAKITPMPRAPEQPPPPPPRVSNEVIEERLSGVPVYTLTNSNEEFVLISGKKAKTLLGLFCFKKEDADVLLQQLKVMDPDMRRASTVVPVALNKIFQLKVNGVAFRLIPDASQIKNALREREKAGLPHKDFVGVPVFQSRSLILSSEKRRYRPVFFRKEDLENSLFRASRQQGKLNPIFRQGDIEVAVLEDIIKEMKDESSRKWDDVVFIPPGFDVSTDPSQIPVS